MRRWGIIVSLVMLLGVGPASPIKAVTTAESKASEPASQPVSDAAMMSQPDLPDDAKTLSSSHSASEAAESSASASSQASSGRDQQSARQKSTSSSSSVDSQISSSSSSADSQTSASQSSSTSSAESSAVSSSSSTSQPSDQQPEPDQPTAPDTDMTQADDALPPAKVKSEVTVLDEDGQELKPGKVAANGTQVRYRFKLTHQAGTAATRKVKFRFTAPNEIRPKQAELQTKQGRVAKIAIDDQRISYELPVQLSDKNDWALIEITGRTEHERVNTVYSGNASYQVDSGQRISMPLPVYVLLADKVPAITMARQSFHVKATDQLEITGRVERETPIIGTRIKFMMMQQDKQVAIGNVDRSDADNGANTTADEEAGKGFGEKFIFKLKAGSLPVGKHELEIYAIDRHKIKSNKIKITIHVTENLGFKNVPRQVQFKPVTLTGQTQVAERQADWQVQVYDDHSNWRLLAAATPFSDPKKGDLAGELVYQNGEQTEPITAKGTVIATAKTQPHFNSDQAWQAQTGILLKTRPDAVPGSYQGKITWTLESVPDDQ